MIKNPYLWDVTLVYAVDEDDHAMIDNACSANWGNLGRYVVQVNRTDEGKTVVSVDGPEAIAYVYAQLNRLFITGGLN